MNVESMTKSTVRKESTEINNVTCEYVRKVGYMYPFFYEFFRNAW